MADYTECQCLKNGLCYLTEKPSGRVHPCPCEHDEECYDPEGLAEQLDEDELCKYFEGKGVTNGS